MLKALALQGKDLTQCDSLVVLSPAGTKVVPRASAAAHSEGPVPGAVSVPLS